MIDKEQKIIFANLDSEVGLPEKQGVCPDCADNFA